MNFYGIHAAKIIYEVLNTEVIVIDFNTGDYYTLMHVAKHIWQLIEQRVSQNRMVQLLSEHYQRPQEEVSSDVQRFIDQLLKEGLIEVIEERGDSQEIFLVSKGWEYHKPELLKYTDVQNLLLLDPIHEVTEAGWPSQLV